MERDRSPSLVYYWYALLFISIALTLVLPQIFTALNHWSSTPNLSRLVANAATVLAALCVQNAVLWSLVGDPVRFRLQWVQTSVTAATVTAMVALFFTIGRLPDAWEFSDYYHLGNVAEYRFVYLSYMGIAALLLSVIWTRFAIASVDLRLKTEFSLLAVGGATGLAYLANDAGVVTRALGWNSPSWWANERYTSLLIGVAVTLMFLGATTPGWLHLIHSIRAHLAFLRLRRLWLRLRAAVPQVVLISVNPFWKDLLDPRGATFKLHRQVVEIRDALLLLRRSADPSSGGREHGGIGHATGRIRELCPERRRVGVAGHERASAGPCRRTAREVGERIATAGWSENSWFLERSRTALGRRKAHARLGGNARAEAQDERRRE